MIVPMRQLPEFGGLPPKQISIDKIFGFVLNEIEPKCNQSRGWKAPSLEFVNFDLLARLPYVPVLISTES